MFFLLILLLCSNVHLSLALLPEKPIAVIMPTYNNASTTVATLDSIIKQKYDNFRVVCIDDASSDGTARVISQYIKSNNLGEKVTLIRNTTRCRKLKNIYNAIHACNDQEIIVQPDGDDMLGHDHVLADINQAYADENVWLTYSRHRNVPREQVVRWGRAEIEYSQVPQKVVDDRSFRQHSWTYGHVKSWYAWLFKCIRLDDLLTLNVNSFEGQFYPAANDVAIMMPMLDMAHWRIKFMPDVSYIRNIDSPLVGWKIDYDIQKQGSKEIRAKLQYPTVKKPIIGRGDYYNTAKADIVILLRDRNKFQDKAVESIKRYVTGVGEVFFVHTVNRGLEQIVQRQAKNQHVLLMSDAYNFIENVDLNYCIKKLEQTFASGFYFNHNLKVHASRVSQHLFDDVYATRRWQNNSQNDLQLVLCRKKGITGLDRGVRLFFKNPKVSGPQGSFLSTRYK